MASSSVEFMLEEFRKEFQRYLETAKGPHKYTLLTANILDILHPIENLHSNEIAQIRETLEGEKKAELAKANQEYEVRVVAIDLF